MRVARLVQSTLLLGYYVTTSAVSLDCCKVTLSLRKAPSTLFHQRRFLERRLRVPFRQPFFFWISRINSIELSSHLVRRVPSFHFVVCHNLICNHVRRSGLYVDQSS